jgi:ribosome-associated toxin RatA of RatAB toxin-antitoxin module
MPGIVPVALEHSRSFKDTAAMRELILTAIVKSGVEAAWAVVNDVARYPDFVPGCSSAEILEQGVDCIVVRLGVRRGPLSTRFTTRNQQSRPHRVQMQLVDGPFKALQGDWLFSPVGSDGCQIELRLRYEFSNPVKGALLQPLLAETANQMVRAFVRRLQSPHD